MHLHGDASRMRVSERGWGHEGGGGLAAHLRQEVEGQNVDGAGVGTGGGHGCERRGGCKQGGESKRARVRRKGLARSALGSGAEEPLHHQAPSKMAYG